MDTLLLTLVGASRVVLPRHVRVEIRGGDGGLKFPAAAPVDEAWRAAAEDAWRAALRLTDARGVEAVLHVAGPQPLAGSSAGLPLGLAFVAALRQRPVAPHFATGTILPGGELGGGAFAAQKARAAAQLAPQLGMSGWRFVAPETAPPVPGVVRVPNFARAVEAVLH